MAVPQSADKPHGYKYSFVYIVKGKRVIGYDNAEGRGDHRHHGDKEQPYKFLGLEKLWRDFTATCGNTERANDESQKY